MAAQQVDQFVLPLFAQGMLGGGFRELQGVEKDNPGIIEEVIKHFFGVADNCIWELTRVVDMPVPIYSCIFHHCNKLKGSCQKSCNCCIISKSLSCNNMLCNFKLGKPRTTNKGHHI